MRRHELAAQFWRDGYLVVEDFFEQPEMERLDAKILDHFARAPEFLHEPDFLERSQTDVIRGFRSDLKTLASHLSERDPSTSWLGMNV